MRVKLTAFLVILFWSTVFFLHAQQPCLEIALADSVAIPYAYDYVLQLPNGNLQFYKLNYSTSAIQFTGFQYLSLGNVITAQVYLGTVANLAGLYPMRRYTMERFGNFYLVHKLISGLMVFKLDENTLMSRSIDEFVFDQYFDYEQQTEIVAEDAMAIALADSLVYYNFIDGSSQTLLQGAEYQCTWQTPRVISLPDSLFVYIKDQTSVSADPEEWTVFNSDGNHLFTQISTDPGLLMNSVAKPSGTGSAKIHGRWYVSAIASDERTCSYECSFIEPDSIHIKFVGTPGSIHEYALRFSPFSDDRILRLYYNDFFESVFMYCNYTPLELFPEVIFSFNWGYAYPALTAVSMDVTTMTVRLPDQIAVLALWTDDFPVVHEFYFPANSDYLGSTYTFTANNLLWVITNDKLYSFLVGVSSATADETMVSLVPSLQIYPNPVRPSQQLMIKSMSKEPSILEIYNIRGQKVKSLQMDSLGQIEWDMRDDTNKNLSSGIYFVKPKSGSITKPSKLVLIN